MRYLTAVIVTMFISVMLAGVNSASCMTQEQALTNSPAVQSQANEHSWQAASQDASEITVYVTKTGSKYHRGDCRYLRQSKYAISLQDAVNQGYDACSVCDPPIIDPADDPNSAQPGDEDITVYRTKTGEKYHVAGCRYLKKSKIALSLKAAKERGLDPCSVCDPPE